MFGCCCFTRSLCHVLVYFCVHVFVDAVVWCWCTVFLFFFFRGNDRNNSLLKINQSESDFIHSKCRFLSRCANENIHALYNYEQYRNEQCLWNQLNYKKTPLHMFVFTVHLLVLYMCAEIRVWSCLLLRTTLVYLLKLLYIWQCLSVTNIILPSNTYNTNIASLVVLF